MKADPQRIHQLEHELGFRDDPPPFQITDEPGAVIRYSPYTQHVLAKAQVWSKRVNEQ